MGIVAENAEIQTIALGKPHTHAVAPAANMKNPPPQTPSFIVAGLLDAVPIIGVAIALLLIFANPFISQLSQ